MIRRVFLGIGLALAVGASSASADLLTFQLDWSGASFGNGATATATITINDLILTNPGSNDSSSGFITFFEITVSGASSGNGTWGLADFSSVFLNTGALALNMNQELVGQPTDQDPWGTSQPGGTGGDFNMFTGGPSAAPNGTWYFQLTTNNGAGDNMLLTNFTPIPEPGSLGLLALGLVGVAGFRRRK